METYFITACLLSVVISQIWLFLIIMEGSPKAALLCLIVPLLTLFFILDHWKLARWPVILGLAGMLGLFAQMLGLTRFAYYHAM